MKIWAAWLQGLDTAPATVRAILSLWERLHPDHDLQVLTQADADAILARVGIKQLKISPQVTTDIVRLVLLREKGGTWVDATLLPTKPLDTWLTGLVQPGGLFAFTSEGDPNLVLQNCFISAEAANPLISRLANQFIDYFSAPRRYPNWKRAIAHAAIPDLISFRRHLAARDTLWFVDPDGGRSNLFYPYAAFNYSLAFILSKEPDMREIWTNVPHRSAFLPHAIGKLASDPETPDAAFLRHAVELLDHSPVHKLNHRDPRFERLISIAAERSEV